MKMKTQHSKNNVSNWETVTTYGATYSTGEDDGACDVDVQIGDDEGVWFIQTCDDAGGSDEADDTQYATEEEALAAAETLAEDRDECDGKSSEQYLADKLAARAKEGEDPEGEFALYWETVLEDAGEHTRYSTHAAAVAAAELAQAQFDVANPTSGGGVNYLCGYSVRRLVDEDWVAVDANGEAANEE